MTLHDPNFETIRDALINALKEVEKLDQALITMGANERSLTHRLAVYLENQQAFRGWHVDCEYNRAGDGVPKRNLGGKRVLPDIIIHDRRSPGRNLLVIEAKKVAGCNPADDDVKKLKCYRCDHSYQHTAFVTFKPLTIRMNPDVEPPRPTSPETRSETD